VRGVTSYVFSLSYADGANWKICKKHEIIGIRAKGAPSARAITGGETIYVWQGGVPRRGTGLLACITASGPARRAHDIPWPDPADYICVIPFRLDEELAEPVPDEFPGHQQGARFKIQNTDLQKGFRPLSAESERLVADCFSAPPGPREPDTPVVIADGGWPADQELISRVEQAAVTAVRKHLADSGWHEVRDCQQDGCGYDLLYEHGDGRRRLVEVKGTAGTEVRFRLTRLEHEVLSRQADSRVYVVLDALADPRVHVLDADDVERLGVVPVVWEVG
jgi:hypothetical protein